ncbi:SPT3 Dosage dependent suppressor of Ty-induced promoter mutations-like protein [Dissophora globulifera]|nr:SPT3 Dosage dependent suppressor of Ty-induced promoter mutations-like protein [Dissophora globulifera]
MSAYSLEARIIQKKDQLEELSATGVVPPTPIVEEVRTGQQFLIKLHLTRNGLTHSPRFPSLRVGRREAINTAGDARAELEPLTLEIEVRLAKSGQIRKSACAKCCHKFGPASPILQLLDPLTPSATDPDTYAHIDTTTGSITMLAKVICSSTDHGERGNKDRYIFEFKLKRTSSMSARRPSNNTPSSPSSESLDDDGETISTCFTPPIMCSGHHKAKRVYPHQRSIKVTKAGPTPKMKTVKREKSVLNTILPSQSQQGEESAGGVHSAGVLGNQSNAGFPGSIPFIPNHFSQEPIIGSYMDQSDDNGIQVSGSSDNNQQFMQSVQDAFSLMQPPQSQQPIIQDIRPNHGPIRKRTDVIIRGMFFQEGMTPFFGFFPAREVDIISSSVIVCQAPESSVPMTVDISFSDSLGNSFNNLGQFTYTDEGETELLILQLQLKMAHRALEHMHMRATGQMGSATDIMKNIPGLVTSPRSGNVAVMDSSSMDLVLDADTPLLSLNEVEEGILKTLDFLPKEVDISMQLEDGSNMLHLSITLGFHRLTIQLIEEGCDLEAQDKYGMTPLMYAVVKGDEAIVRTLITAGASSSGAKSPQEFYDRLPYVVEPTLAMSQFLNVGCTRFSNAATSADHLLETLKEEGEEGSGMDGIEDGQSDDLTNTDDSDAHTDTDLGSSASVSPVLANAPRIEVVPAAETGTSVASRDNTAASSSEGDMMTKLRDAMQVIRVNHSIPPLDQQDLPPMYTVEKDGSITVNTKVVQGSDIAYTGNVEAGHHPDVNQESGYHSGVYSEVQERLNRLHLTTLPSEGVKMTASFKNLWPTNPASLAPKPASTTSMPLEVIRTGDLFAIEIQLSTMEEDGQLPMPKEYLGLRFPHELVKRVSGKPASILTEMTYTLNTSIELGNLDASSSSSSSSSNAESEECTHGNGDGIALAGSCKPCSKFLHEQKKLSPSRQSTFDPSVYPILQFNIPSLSATSSASTTTAQGTATTPASADSAGVIELRNGACEVRAKVNCSSMHHWIQRERTKLKQQQEQASSSSSAAATTTPSSSSSSSTAPSETLGSSASPAAAAAKKSLTKANLRDPGYVFKFELVHPTLNKVVARCETQPIIFQTYARGRS